MRIWIGANVLLVDDDKRFLEATVQLLTLLGHSVTAADSIAQAREVISKNQYTHMILDLILPDGSGLHLLEGVAAQPKTKITLITGHPSIKSIIKNLYGSNISYLIKPIDLAQLKSLFEDNKTLKTKTDSAVKLDRKSTRLNSSHVKISYAVFCLKKKKKK